MERTHTNGMLTWSAFFGFFEVFFWVFGCNWLTTYSQPAKALAVNPVYQGRSKHILARWHFVRERVESGQVKLEDVRTAYMATYMLTNSVGPAILAVDMKLVGMNVQSG